jgi:hypothetical protein
MPETLTPIGSEQPVEAAPPAASEPILTLGQKVAAELADTQPETAAVEAPPVVSPRIEKLKALGFENVASEDEAFERLVTAYQNTKNEFGSQLQAALAELKQTAAQPPEAPVAPVAPVAPDARAGKWQWAPPAVDPQLLAFYRTADGWKPETPAEIKHAAEARQRYFDSFATKFVSDPAAALEPLLEDKFNAYFDQRFERISAQQQAQTFQQKLFTDNPWLFESNPVSAKPNFQALSSDGKLIDQYMKEAQSRGADYELAWEFAVGKHAAAKAALTNKQTTTAQAAVEVNGQKKQEMLNRAGGTPNRTGSLPLASDSRTTQWNRNLTPGQRAIQLATKNGVAIN